MKLVLSSISKADGLYSVELPESKYSPFRRPNMTNIHEPYHQFLGTSYCCACSHAIPTGSDAFDRRIPSNNHGDLCFSNKAVSSRRAPDFLEDKIVELADRRNSP